MKEEYSLKFGFNRTISKESVKTLLIATGILAVVIIGLGLFIGISEIKRDIHLENAYWKKVLKVESHVVFRYSDINEWFENMGGCRCIYYNMGSFYIFEDDYTIAHLYNVKPYDRGFGGWID